MTDFERKRRRMVDQIARFGVRGEDVLAAMNAVPRERFVDAGLAERAYDDSPLPIGEGQTISQPYIVAAMIAAAEVGPSDRVLEVGAGSGYASAVLSRIAVRVFTIERHPPLAAAAAQRFAALGYRNIELRIGDGTLGWPDAAPFNAILVSAAGRDVPAALTRQLAIGGRLVMPVDVEVEQRLVKLRRTGENSFERRDLGAVVFVPLVTGEVGPRS